MKYMFKPSQRINAKQPASMHTFALMNSQFLSNQEINCAKAYLTPLAHQTQYRVAAIRAQLLLGWIYARKSNAATLQTKQFYALKAKQYLSKVALQTVYPKGQKCALTLLQSLAQCY